MAATESKGSAERDTVKRWADEHDAIPVRTARSAGDADVDLLPERDVSNTMERATWDEFFEELERENEVVIYTESDEDPFVVTHRTDVATRSHTEDIEQALLEGDTVTTEITETAVVESIVTE